MVLFGIGHELIHYLFLERENRYKNGVAQYEMVYINNRLHHCDFEFQEFNKIVIDEIWSMYHMNRNRMYDEIIKSCSNHPEQ